MLNEDNNQYTSRGALYDAISSRIGQRLHELKVQVDKLALEQSFRLQDNTTLHNLERATGILQQVDWEAFGMQSYLTTEDDSNTSTNTTQNQWELNVDQAQEEASSERYFRVGFSREGGMMSRIRGYVDPTELMGFAARGLFMNNRIQKESPRKFPEVGPLKIWKQFSDEASNIFSQWNRS